MLPFSLRASLKRRRPCSRNQVGVIASLCKPCFLSTPSSSTPLQQQQQQQQQHSSSQVRCWSSSVIRTGALTSAGESYSLGLATRRQEQDQLVAPLLRNPNDNPVGSWTNTTWCQGLETLRRLTTISSSSSSSTSRRQHQQLPNPQGVQQACRLFERLVQEWNHHQHHADPQQAPPPLSFSWGDHNHHDPTRTLNTVVQCWFHCYTKAHADNTSPSLSSSLGIATPVQMCAWIERVTAGMAAPHTATGTAPTTTPVNTWNLILEAALLRRDGTSTARFCESLLDRMLQASSLPLPNPVPVPLQSSSSPPSPSLPSSSSSPPLHSSLPPTSPLQDTLNTSISRQALPLELETPNAFMFTQSFNKVMTAYVQHEKDVTSAERCLHHLQQLYILSSDQSQSLSLTVRPQPETYSIVLAGWAKQGAARQAERVLQSMMELADKVQDISLMPTKTHFESCLNGWRNSKGQRIAGQRAELLLLKMDELHKELDLDTQPCIKSIGKVLQCWVDSRHADAASRSEAILQLMREHYYFADGSSSDNSSSIDDVKTLTEGYANVLRAWSLSGLPEAPEKTETLFRDLQEQVGEKNISSKVLEKCYNAMMTALTRSGRKGAAVAAQAIFDDMDRKCRNGECDFLPGNQMYNSLLHGWARDGNGLRAEQVLEQMHRDYRAGNQNAKPETRHFNSVMLAWSKSKDANASDRAENVFSLMNTLTASGEFDLKPDVVSINALLSSLNAAGTHDVATARRGEKYLHELKTLYAAGDSSCRPNAVTYTKAILLWSNVQASESVERAQAMLNEMHKLVVLGSQTARPMALAYEAFIKVLQNSDLPDKHQRAQQVRDGLKRLGLSQKNN